ncbi:MAG: hypothetical protein ABH878_02870 [bacterium]
MTRVFSGKIHGQTIHLDNDPALPDGEKVEVRIKAKRIIHLKKALGGWVDDPSLDVSFEKIARDRHSTRLHEVEH